MLHFIQKRTSGPATKFITLAMLVLALMWILRPYLQHNNYLSPHSYYRLGSHCLNDYQTLTFEEDFKLINTYAKKVSRLNHMVLIQARNKLNNLRVEVECVYSDVGLEYISVNGQPINLAKFN